MTTNEENRAGARLVWALITPFVLAAGLLFLPLVPMFCVLLDARSRTYTGAVTLIVFSAAAIWLFGPMAGAVSAFVVVSAAAAYVLLRMRVPFPYGLAGSAGGGVLGAMALLGILGLSLGRPINEAVAGAICNALSLPALAEYLNITVTMFRPDLQTGNALMQMFFGVFPKQVLDMTLADKLSVVQPVLENVFSAYIPAWALAAGLLTGSAAYYLPALATARLPAWKPAGGKNVEVPPFFQCRFPKYAVISILLLQLVSYFMMDNGAMFTLYVASNMVMTILMTTQALALFSFFLSRKKLPTLLQVVILAPAALLFSWLLEFVGLFDVLFDLRAVALRVEAVKAKGKQVFTQGGLDELRNMSKDKKNGKNDGNGEDGKK